MSLVWYALWFVIAVGLLVTVHEFGHFWVARRLGFKVLRFSVGFGRPLFRKVAGADQTEYVIAAIPLACPGFNILFAILVLWGMFWVNGETEIRPLVGDVVKGSVADRAGLRSG